ncbi:MAG: hypothetical protein ACTSQC_03675 [Candidatus Heimdallarchaeaceae archaeon]|nr:hypothetical protein [Candidatus Heimdallarchaeota archaeon]
MFSDSDPNQIMSEEEIVKYLLDSLEDERKDFSIFAIRQLKHYHSAKIVEKLLRIVEEEKDSDKKIAALGSLKKRKPNIYTKDVVLKHLLSPEEEIRTEAANVLIEYDESIISDLETIYSNNLQNYAVDKIVWLLGKVGTPDTLTILLKYRETLQKENRSTLDDAVENIKRKYIKMMFKEIEKKENE